MKPQAFIPEIPAEIGCTACGGEGCPVCKGEGTILVDPALASVGEDEPFEDEGAYAED